jgi:hypothetical protein
MLVQLVRSHVGDDMGDGGGSLGSGAPPKDSLPFWGFAGLLPLSRRGASL